MPPDPHVLQDAHLPTPFTAAEIRDGCPPGRTVRSLVVEAGADPYVQVTRFVSGDETSAEQDSWTETLDGRPRTEPARRRSTWLEFQRHASMPAAMTTIEPESIDIPAGRYECLRYTRADGGQVATFWFATAAPGMPLKFEEQVAGEVVYSSTAIEDRRP